MPATLAFNVDPRNGVLSGSFSSNGTPFQATGTGISTSQGLDLEASVFSGTSGGISGSVGAGIGNFQTGPHVGATMQNGSTGLVSGHLDVAGHFTGRYKANISNYTLALICSR
ncbi:hypothetical protein MF271_22795 (plasmid) [Deinococcus sp. KNUC1210]|uniref:hypothetical protein n=1 Tax=Deinococcus sp. KNUC1210 TaxID=2917691 RepID=UPI001EF1002C|nr:hypothetical protein [Deinococcus sp. KNUC1210]ULH18292.1 hypothetical protein MF271_22795 [Deinococcus sp. KNUC1210]